jgi:predicted dehydrogenase
MPTTTAKIRPPSQPVRVGVIGAGQMGSNHLRIYSGLKGVELVGLVDADAERARAAAALHGCRVFASAQELAGEIDAATIAVPSSRHGDVAGALLERGVHCLVEKPLATTEAECEALIGAADASGAVLLVGHVERFNPVVRQLAKILRGNVVHAIDVRRMSALSARITDVDVVADLMIHDIDVVLSLLGTDVSDVIAHGVRSAGGAGHDYVTATLLFASGSLATLTASRITHNKIREVNVTADVGYVTANYINQELLIHSQAQTTGSVGADGGTNYVLDLATERVLIRPEEPLDVEIRHFVDCIQHARPPLVSGRDALNAMRFVWEIQRLLAGLQAPAPCPT